MKKILITLIILTSTISFSQEEIDCYDYLPLFEDLAEHHKTVLINYCNKIETDTSNSNQNLKTILQNKNAFVGNYFNFFMNNLESKDILRNLAKNEKYFISCLKDESFKYDVKSLFDDIKKDLEYEVSNDFTESIDFMFDYILKKVKVN